MSQELTAKNFGKKHGLTRARIHQLVKLNRIAPPPEKRMIGDATWVYFFKPSAKILKSDLKRGRPTGSKNKVFA